MLGILLLCTIALYCDAMPIYSLEISSEVKDIFPVENDVVKMQKVDINKDGVLSAAELEHDWIIQNGRTEDEKAKYYGNLFQEFDEDFDLSLTPEEAANMLRTRYLVAVRDDFPFDFLKFDEDRTMGLEFFEYMQFESKFPFTNTDPLTVEELEELAKAQANTTGSDIESIFEDPHGGESDRIVDQVQKLPAVEDITKEQSEEQEATKEETKFDIPNKKVEKMPLMKPVVHQTNSPNEPPVDSIASIMLDMDERRNGEQSTPSLKPVAPGSTTRMISSQ